MILKKLPAKDVPIGATVKVLDETPASPPELEFTITDRADNYPIPSMIAWKTEVGATVVILKNVEVEIVNIPEATA